MVFNLNLPTYFQMAKFLRVVSFMKEPSYTSEFLGKTLAEWLVYYPSVTRIENSTFSISTGAEAEQYFKFNL